VHLRRPTRTVVDEFGKKHDGVAAEAATLSFTTKAVRQISAN